MNIFPNYCGYEGEIRNYKDILRQLKHDIKSRTQRGSEQIKMEDKILWKKPDYKKQYTKVSDEEVNRLCLEGSSGTGDIIIAKEQYGRKITFTIHRVEKVGELIEGIDTLTRTQAINELKRLEEKQKGD